MPKATPESAANTYLKPSAGISDPARVVRLHARVDGLDAHAPITCHLPVEATDARQADVTDGAHVIRDNAWDNYRRFAESLGVRGLPERYRVRGDLSGEWLHGSLVAAMRVSATCTMDSNDLD